MQACNLGKNGRPPEGRKSSVFPEVTGYALQERLSHDIPSSLSSRLGAQVSLQGAPWRRAPAGPGNYQAGLRRDGRDDHQWSAVKGPRAHVRRNPAACLRQRLRAQSQGAFVTENSTGV